MSNKPTKVSKQEIIEYKTDNQLTKNKYNYKLTEEDKKSILLEYYISNKRQNIDNICNKYNISRAYLYKLINKYKDNKILNKSIENSLAESRKKFAKKIDALMLKTIDRINDELNDDTKDLNISQLTTTLGILYDKNQLEQGKSTSNNAFSINIKIDK